MNNTRIKFGDKIEYCDNLYDCLIEADALIIATEWTVFRNPDFQKMQDMMKETVIFDGRNLYSNTEMEKLKFEYHCIGRKGINTK
jgi:UDPglucose 6-dehydrogenase